MRLFDLIAVSSSPSLIAGVCILLQAWCLLIEVKDHLGFYLAATLLLQFALPLVPARMLQAAWISPPLCGVLLEYGFVFTAALGCVTALYVLIVNRHRVPDLTVYSLWSLVFTGCTYFIQSSAYASFSA